MPGAIAQHRLGNHQTKLLTMSLHDSIGSPYRPTRAGQLSSVPKLERSTQTFFSHTSQHQLSLLPSPPISLVLLPLTSGLELPGGARVGLALALAPPTALLSFLFIRLAKN